MPCHDGVSVEDGAKTGHLLQANARTLAPRDIEWQCFWPLKPREFIHRHPWAERDVSEEIRDRTAAGLQEISDRVVHVLQFVGEILLFDVNDHGGCRSTLEDFRTRIGHMGQLVYFASYQRLVSKQRDNIAGQRGDGKADPSFLPSP